MRVSYEHFLWHDPRRAQRQRWTLPVAVGLTAIAYVLLRSGLPIAHQSPLTQAAPAGLWSVLVLGAACFALVSAAALIFRASGDLSQHPVILGTLILVAVAVILASLAGGDAAQGANAAWMAITSAREALDAVVDGLSQPILVLGSLCAVVPLGSTALCWLVRTELPDHRSHPDEEEFMGFPPSQRQRPDTGITARRPISLAVVETSSPRLTSAPAAPRAMAMAGAPAAPLAVATVSQLPFVSTAVAPPSLPLKPTMLQRRSTAFEQVHFQGGPLPLWPDDGDTTQEEEGFFTRQFKIHDCDDDDWSDLRPETAALNGEALRYKWLTLSIFVIGCLAIGGLWVQNHVLHPSPHGTNQRDVSVSQPVLQKSLD